MKTIFIAGAGLSTSTLVSYLLDYVNKFDWQIIIGDLSIEHAQSKINNHNRAKAIKFDVFDNKLRDNIISKSDLVISMLPSKLQPLMAKSCLEMRTNMITASYVSKVVRKFDAKARKNNVLILNETGLDPGIDHISAMKIIDDIKAKGAKITAFKSYTGGLVAPKYDNNPWNYKFTWNPRNVVLAGQGVSQYITQGKYKYIPYHKLFARTKRVHVLDYGEFEAYPNRDSLSYREIYGLKNIPTMFRGTLRRPGFCKSWNIFVQLGATNDTYTLENSENITYRDFINSFLRYEENIPVETKLSNYLNIDEDSIIMYRLRWLGIFAKKKIGLKNATPAQILLHLLKEKWKLEKEDKDMIVMQHEINYKLDNKNKTHISSLVVEGDSKHSAMSKTVGYPLGIAAKLILTDKIKEVGIIIPTLKSIYIPILKELEEVGIVFINEIS